MGEATAIAHVFRTARLTAHPEKRILLLRTFQPLTHILD